MSKPKFNFKLEDEESSKEEIVKPIKSTNLVKYEPQSFWEQLMDTLPSPEEEIETMKKDEVKLEELIQETKQVLEKIEARLNENLDLNLDQDDKIELAKKQEYYTNMLETFETELSYTKVQHKSLNKMINEDDDDSFNESLPELLANTIVSSKKKMEDVNSVVNSIDKISKKNRIEECIICEVNIKDDKGRKASIQHIHLSGFDAFKKYKPVLCIKCFKEIKEDIEELKTLEIPEIFEDDSETTCKKGNKIFSLEMQAEIPAFSNKCKKLIDLESKEFIESIKVEEKNSFFGFKF